jgi:hypothetical protein
MKGIVFLLAVIFQISLTKNRVLYKFISNPFKNSSLCDAWADNVSMRFSNKKDRGLEMQGNKKRAYRRHISACGCTPKNGRWQS